MDPPPRGVASGDRRRPRPPSAASAAPFAVAPVLAVVEVPSQLVPRSDAATTIAGLWWLMFTLGVAIFAVVVALTAVALLRRREQTLEDDRVAGEAYAGGGNLLMLAGGVALPVVVILLLVVAMINVGARVQAYSGNPSSDLVIEVTGWKFWWDVEYPDEGVRIANELHIPVGQPVDVRVRAGDVIHSWWVPQLAGRMDMKPEAVNATVLEAAEPGVYRGICTEYCGVQHAHMHFVVVAHTPDEFARWLADRQQPPDEPETPAQVAGREVFVAAGCGECHTVEGVSPRNDRYPDLTHLADRRTIAGGILANNRGNLGGWILDPQALKPGNRMPPANLTGDELTALLAYLETLR